MTRTYRQTAPAVCALVACAAISLLAGCREKTDRAKHVSDSAWFTDIAADVGIEFVYENGAKGDRLMPELMGSGVALFDFDNDGDLDLWVSNIQSRARVYRNDAPRKGAWLMVRALDPRLRRDAIGARVTVTFGGRRLVRTVTRSSSYLSSSDARAHFGLGGAKHVTSVELRWPDGLRESFPSIPVNRVVTLVRGSGRRS